MQKGKMQRGMMLIGNAIIWGLVIIGCSLALKGTGAYQEIQTILGGGAMTTMFLILFGTRANVKKPKDENAEQKV